jgi:CRISPR-associated protein Cas2
MRRRYLITYDVSDDKRRNKVFSTLMDNGDHVQYSVFLCELNGRELAQVKGDLGQEIHHDEDQVLVLDLGKADHDLASLMRCIGKAYEPPTRVQVI